MPQYQSFPDAAGDSVSLEKLKALRLPPLAGRSFLDVGCNEGYFCGFALFAGASKVVGLDASELFIERARRRFTQASFQCQSWDNLPDAPFDVVLLASALHYAEDQAALLTRLVGALSDNGVLVLELGIAPGETNEWCEVERGIDSRWFPTWPTLMEILSPYEWKDIGPSVNQRGDPIPRRVIHVCRRRPRPTGAAAGLWQVVVVSQSFYSRGHTGGRKRLLPVPHCVGRGLWKPRLAGSGGVAFLRGCTGPNPGEGDRSHPA
jgi:SAM-dependent methyltransferase